MILKASLCLQYHRANSVLWFLTHLTKHQKTGLNCLGHKDHSVILHRYSPRNQMHHIPLLWVKGPAFFAWLCSGWENLFQGTPGLQSLTSVWPSAVTLWICLRIHLGKILIFNFSVSFPPHMLQVNRNEYPCCLAKQQHWIRHMLRGTDVYWEAYIWGSTASREKSRICLQQLFTFGFWGHREAVSCYSKLRGRKVGEIKRCLYTVLFWCGWRCWGVQKCHVKAVHVRRWMETVHCAAATIKQGWVWFTKSIKLANNDS